MCLLNGECGGGLPAPVIFDSYDQIIPAKPGEVTVNDEGKRVSVQQRIYDIIQTLVCNYGGEPLTKIFINDVPLEIKQIVRYTGSLPLYYNSNTDIYTTNESLIEKDEQGNLVNWVSFDTNDNIGYVYTDFIYPGSLQSGIGENICSVLDKIRDTLGNYEYFYDIYGNFVFQEIKNYLNTSYTPIKDGGDNSILNKDNYKVEFNNSSKTVYDFIESDGLISAYTNTPNYTNIKNDFHIWGKNGDSTAIHYHLAIKEKPTEMREFKVTYLRDKNFKYTGRLRLAKNSDYINPFSIKDNVFIADDEEKMQGQDVENKVEEETLFLSYSNICYANGDILSIIPIETADYIPEDWRAELYLEGLEKIEKDIRPNIYEQEILDNFDSIYNFKDKKFKGDVTKPNILNYFIDYLTPSSSLIDISIDTIQPKIYSYQQDNIRFLYPADVHNLILINTNEDIIRRIEIKERCEKEDQPYSNIDPSIYGLLSRNVIGYTAQDTARNLLYQYTHYNESITLQVKPIYYLDVNQRISVNDLKTGIMGDYIITNISMPLDINGIMSITASKVVDRI
jgi:hypothetical protein